MIPSMVSKQGSSARLSITVSPARFRIMGWQARLSRKVPKQGCKKGSTNRFPSKVSQEQVAHVPRNSFPRTTCKAKFRWTAASKVGSKNRIPSKVLKDRFLKQGSQAKLRKTGSRARSQWRGLNQAGKVSKNRFPSKAPKNRFPSKVPMNKCQARFPRTVAEARFPRTVNNRMLQSLKTCSNNGTEKLKN